MGKKTHCYSPNVFFLAKKIACSQAEEETGDFWAPSPSFQVFGVEFPKVTQMFKTFWAFVALPCFRPVFFLLLLLQLRQGGFGWDFPWGFGFGVTFFGKRRPKSAEVWCRDVGENCILLFFFVCCCCCCCCCCWDFLGIRKKSGCFVPEMGEQKAGGGARHHPLLRGLKLKRKNSTLKLGKIDADFGCGPFPGCNRGK